MIRALALWISIWYNIHIMKNMIKKLTQQSGEFDFFWPTDGGAKD